MTKQRMVNFVTDASKNYKMVQDELIEIIGNALPADSEWGRNHFTIEGAINLSFFIRKQADILMSHGLADKNYLTDIRLPTGELYLNQFKGVLVPGNFLKRKLTNNQEVTLETDQIKVVGWPRIDLLRKLGTMNTLRGLERDATNNKKKKLIWAPSHNFAKKGDGLHTSSFPLFQQYIPQLERYFDVEISLHPRNRPNKETTKELLLKADIVVADFGTTLYESWALNKPVIFPSWLISDLIIQWLPQSAEAYVYENKIGYHPRNISELIDIALSATTVGYQVDEFMKDYLLNYKQGNSLDVIARALLST